MFDTNRENLPTRDRLLLTAAELMLRQSYGAVSVDDICKAADIKKGGFYHHFPSKIELALAAYDFMWAEMEKKIGACFSPDVPVMQRLENWAEGAYQCHKQMFDAEGKIYGCPLATAGQEMGAQDDRIRDKINQITAAREKYILDFIADLQAQGLARDAEVEQVAREMSAYITGVFFQAKIANDPEVIRRDMLPGLKRLLGLNNNQTIIKKAVGE